MLLQYWNTFDKPRFAPLKHKTMIVAVLCLLLLGAVAAAPESGGPVYGHILRQFLDDADPAAPDVQAYGRRYLL
jgi:hypothetical protein